MPILIILLDAIEIVEPVAGVERRVPVEPKGTAAELVRSRSGDHLHLPGTASHLGVHGCGDDAHFLYQVGTRVGHRKGAMIVSPIGDDEAISRRVHCTETPTGKVAGISGCRTIVRGGAADRVAHATCRPEQIQHIAPTKRKIAHLVVGKHAAYG